MTYTVYALIDPRKPKVHRYIGLTRNSPHSRLQGHYGDIGAKVNGGGKLSRKEVWLDRIRNEGFKAQAVALEEVDGIIEGMKRECEWFKKSRATILNAKTHMPYSPAHARAELEAA